MTSRKFVAAIAALIVGVVITSASAQTPQQQPLVQPGNLAYLGKFTLPTTDGTGRGTAEGGLTWGGPAMGMGPDGQSLYFGCHDWGNRIARVRIPALGATGSVAEPCAPIANLSNINPGDPNSKKLGGSLWWNGRLTISAYSYYDGNGTAVASHFLGTTVANQAGPYRVGPTNPGLVGGYMGVIPQEWRGLLGGPALTGQCCIAVIARSSFGPSASVFNPDDLGKVSPVPSTMLVGYPEAHQTFGPWNVPNPYFTGITRVAGIAFPAGTRTVLFIGRHGSTFCYGTGTANQSLAGTPDGQGNIYCYDPIDLSKGSHGYPYRHQVWAYDAVDLLAVKQGTKNAWDVKPYAVWTLTEMNNKGSANLRSATYDPATRRLYAVGDNGDAAPVIHVYEITNAVLGPPEEICGDGLDNDGDGQVDEGCGAVVEVCGDLIDNDGDGLVDEGCKEICGDKVDNDGDGLVDEGCVEICGDKIDNDGDGLVDEGCGAVVEICGDKIDNDGDGLVDEGCVEICGDKVDNDGDGLVDEGCVEICGDKVDNDGDGLIDEGCGAVVEICGDKIDNDGDGLVDEGCVEICGDKVDNDGDGLVDEGCEGVAAKPGVPQRVSGSVRRSTVSLKWTAPLTGGIVRDYLVEAGVMPGQTLYSTAVGTAISVSVPNVGTGRYYLRVRARNANGVSAASNEVVLSVGCARQPRQATELTATTSEGVVNLAWSDPDGCSDTQYTVSIMGENAATVQTLTAGDTNAMTLLPKGTYLARVKTLAASGSNESEALKFTVKGDQCAPPRFQTQLKSSLTGRHLGLSWSPLDPDLATADDEVAPVAFVLEAGSAPGAADFGTAPMDRQRAFESGVPPGVYFVRVRAVNACGAGQASNEVRLEVR